MATKTVTNKKTTFDADTNADIACDFGAGTTGADTQRICIASDSSMPLPTGAATAAKQDTGNTSVASIDTKTPALGQALAAASVPVVLTAAQITTLTPPASVGITGDVTVVGKAAHDAAVSGNPVLIGTEARSTRGTAVANGDVVRSASDLYGRSLSISPFVTQTSSAGTAITTNTNTSAVAAPSAGSHLRIHRLLAQNSSATGTWLYWTEGSGGAKKYPMYLAQNQVVTIKLSGEWELPTATALFINTATTGANIEWHVGHETVAD